MTDASRPAAIEDPTNTLVVHRLSAAVLPLAIRSGIHPNMVSLLGLACAGGAGTAYHHWREPAMVLVGFLFMIGWHVCDGLDGQLARATGKASATGRLVDGICDYLAFFAILIPVAVSFPDWEAKLTLCLSAGAAHGFQAGIFEGIRAGWIRRWRGRFEPEPRPTTGSFMERGHNALEQLAGSGERPIDGVLRARPELLPRILATTAPFIRALQPLSANGRTLALPLFCLAGHAEWFWWWELVALNLYMGIVVIGLRNAEARIVADAGAMLDLPPIRHLRGGGGYKGAE